jgi:hypothetical protein
MPFAYVVKDVLSRNRRDLPSLEGLESIFGFLTPQHIQVLTYRGVKTR